MNAFFFFNCLSPAKLTRAAEEGGFSYAIVRPGQIKGDPFLTYSKAGGAALSPDAPEKGSAKRMVSLRQGDSEAGDVNPSSVAEVFTQVCMYSTAAACIYMWTHAPRCLFDGVRS